VRPGRPPPGERRGSGGPYEDRYGYSRVVRVGPLAVTAGCTAVADGVVQSPGDAGGQAEVAFSTAIDALASVGADVASVIATRMYVTTRDHAESVGLVHGRLFGAVRPAATMVVVAGQRSTPQRSSSVSRVPKTGAAGEHESGGHRHATDAARYRLAVPAHHEAPPAVRQAEQDQHGEDGGQPGGHPAILADPSVGHRVEQRVDGRRGHRGRAELGEEIGHPRPLGIAGRVRQPLRARALVDVPDGGDQHREVPGPP
jgi:enamine deaminase RidA (YjgF/YER057c/UK114 family)